MRGLVSCQKRFTITSSLPLELDLTASPAAQDYYCHTAFEFVSSAPGAGPGEQAAVLAGGRYDGLYRSLGGIDVAGIGTMTNLHPRIVLHWYTLTLVEPCMHVCTQSHRVGSWCGAAGSTICAAVATKEATGHGNGSPVAVAQC